MIVCVYYFYIELNALDFTAISRKSDKKAQSVCKYQSPKENHIAIERAKERRKGTVGKKERSKTWSECCYGTQGMHSMPTIKCILRNIDHFLINIHIIAYYSYYVYTNVLQCQEHDVTHSVILLYTFYAFYIYICCYKYICMRECKRACSL